MATMDGVARVVWRVYQRSSLKMVASQLASPLTHILYNCISEVSPLPLETCLNYHNYSQCKDIEWSLE